MFLFRPVGINELRLIAESDFRAFPPRLPQQPIFYPVLVREYAVQIARDWNVLESGQVGFVTRFEIDDPFANRYPIQVVGDKRHQELWVPAEELAEFNSHRRSHRGRGGVHRYGIRWEYRSGDESSRRAAG